MNERRELRASDSDRQAAVERLRAAHDEGRLDLHEFDSRVLRAYNSVTYGDIADLFADLPATRPGAISKPAPAPAPVAPRPAPGLSGAVADMPVALKVLLTIWLSIVFVNVTVWLLVSVNNDGPENFWPVWLAIPGAALAGVTVGVTAIRRGRRPTPR